MVDIYLKRKGGNKSVTYGRLEIPSMNFSCRTLELADSAGRIYKGNCNLEVGTYQLVQGYGELEPMFLKFRYKPVGYFKRPEFVLQGGDYMHLHTGDIALGTEYQGDWAIAQPYDFAQAFRDLCRRINMKREIVSLTIYKGKNYEESDKGFESAMQTIENMMFAGEDDDE